MSIESNTVVCAVPAVAPPASGQPKGPSLKKQTVSGIKWLVGSSFLQKGIQFASAVVLARILGPSDFGLFALAFVAIDALSLFKSMGFDSALIQRKDNIEKSANTAFFIIPLLGIILYLTLAVLAPFIGMFLNNQQVVPVIRALGVIFVISCFGKVPAALLEKNMRFARVTVIEVSTAVIYSVSAITFALLKYGVWSLVIAYILKTINQNTLTFIFSGWRPKFEFDKKIAFEMFHFGKFLCMGGLVWFLKMNLDNIIIGKLLGVTALGLYAIAFNIANLFSDYFGDKINRVFFPAFSKLHSEKEDLINVCLKVLRLISLIAFPVGISLIFLSKEVIVFVYGHKWLDVAPILRILAWAGIFNVLPTGFGAAFLAYGKPTLVFWLVSLQVLIFALFIIPMTKYFGSIGVALVVVITSLINCLIVAILAKKVLLINLKQIGLALKPGMLASILLSFGIIVLKSILVNFNSIIPDLASMVITFVSVIVLYFLVVFRIEKSLFKELRNLVFA